MSRGSVKAWRVVSIALMLTSLIVASAAQAKSHHPPKPSVKISGISVNQQDFPPGTKVTGNSPINACYGIGGPAFDPQSLTAVAFVHAVAIPRNATTTLDFTTPWASAGNGAEHVTKQFHQILFTDRGHGLAGIFGGASGPYDYYTYLMLPTGYPTSSYIDGRYAVGVTIKVGRTKLHAFGSITITC